MRLKQLVLHNFGIYSGTVEINFENKNPVVLVGGMNGHGKTTILEAILLSLYGRRSFAFTESKMSFGQYLSKYVNQGDGSNETFIELKFLINEFSANPVEIDVTRSWRLKKTLSSMDTLVSKNGKNDEYLSENWDMFIETVLPCALSSLFFFDGEKIADLANTDDDEGIKRSIRSLLGIDVIDYAIADLKKVVAAKGKQIQSNEKLREITRLEKEVAEEESRVKDAIEAYGKLDILHQRTLSKLQKAEDAFLASGGKAFESRASLLDKKAHLEAKLNELTAQLIEQLSGDSPLLMVLPLLEQILVQAEKERDQRGIDIALTRLPQLFEEYSKGQEKSVDFDAFIAYVKEKSLEKDVVYNLSENGYIRLRNLCSSLQNNARVEMERIADRRREVIDEIAEVDNYLSANIDEVAVNHVYQEVLQLTTKVAQLTEQRELARKDLEEAQAKYDAKKKEHLRMIEKAVGAMETSEDIKRTVTYSGYAIRVLQEYKTRLQRERVQALASSMTGCFNTIVAKEHLIERIEIEPDSLSFAFYDGHGISVSRASLSAGEKQLLIIAMLWALAICSKKEFPVIVDTPLARLDSAHRESLIRNYFPQASKQMVLLSTDSEVYGKYYDMIKPFVDHEITLAYDEETRKSYVVSGYFGGEH